MFTAVFLWDTYQPASEFAFTDRIQPTRPTTFLTNAYPTDKTPIFNLSLPEGPATTSVAEREEEAPREDIAATILYPFSKIKLFLEPSFKY